ncbi:Importin subunit alpha-1 [Portunus trituberculatus]|uniref:Importin subunit alpha-1 n=1 Tax=Portunus trituberculatus TaxID=210409 RepID=A0A5B7J2Q6_PORTR|nr:Importin subunit alpha-1 [Portunus trituberculatus]
MSKVQCKGVDATKETRTRMREHLMADTIHNPLEVTRYFRHLVNCVQDPPFEEIYQEIESAGCVPKFIHILQKDSCLEVQKEAAWVLGNMSGGDDKICKAVFDAGVVAPMISLINCDNSEIRELAAHCLANIVTLPGVFEQIAQNVFKPLLSLLAKDEVLPNASALLRNLCGCRNPYPPLSTLRPCLPTLIHLVWNNNVSVSDDACNVLAHLIRIHRFRLSPSFDSSFFTEFHKLLKYVASSSV